MCDRLRHIVFLVFFALLNLPWLRWYLVGTRSLPRLCLLLFLSVNRLEMGEKGRPLALLIPGQYMRV